MEPQPKPQPKQETVVVKPTVRVRTPEKVTLNPNKERVFYRTDDKQKV